MNFKLHTKKMLLWKSKIRNQNWDPEKISWIQNLGPPKSLRDLRGFLGLASYYRKFVPLFSKIAKPLNELLQTDSDLNWQESQQTAFNELKKALCSAPILQHFNLELQTTIHCDSSAYGLGAACCRTEDRKERFVAYASRTLNKTERNYSTIEREFLSLLFAMEKFRPYIYGTPFTVITDHYPLTGLKFAKNASSGKLHRWAVRLSEFHFTLVY